MLGLNYSITVVVWVLTLLIVPVVVSLLFSVSQIFNIKIFVVNVTEQTTVFCSTNVLKYALFYFYYVSLSKNCALYNEIKTYSCRYVFSIVR